MKKISFLILCTIYLTTAYCQLTVSPELTERITGKTKFYDIKATVENYYEEKKAALGPTDTSQQKKYASERKKWNRYFYESESHLNSSGEIENAAQKTFEYLSANNMLNINSANSTNLTGQGNWSFIGPTDVAEGIGRINRIEFDPSNPLIIYAGSSGGGLFKSVNDGISWSSVASFIPSLGISGIVATSSNTIYVLTGDGDSYSSGGLTYEYGYIRYSTGVLKTVDGGNSWQATAPFPGLENERYCGMNLVRDPNNPNVLLAATTHGLFRTTNGGSSWTRSDLGLPNDSIMVYDVKFAPGRSDLVYCTVRRNNEVSNGRFLRSVNGGVSFPPSNTVTFSPNVFTDVQRIGIAVTPAEPNWVYLVAGPGEPSTNYFKGVWRSLDTGANFLRMSNTPNVLGRTEDNDYRDQNLYDLAFAASPTNANIVVAGGLVIFKSTTAGVLFSQQTPYHGSTSIHPDVHHLVYNNSNGKLYAATDGGVSVSSNNGTDWTKIFNGLTCTQFYHFGVADDAGNIWGGAQDNGILRKNGTASTFDRYAGGDGYDVLTDLAPAGNQDDKYYSINEKVYADALIDVEITPPLQSGDFFANLAMSPTNEDIIYAGYKKIFVSYDRGSNWNSIFFNTDYIPGNWSINTCPTNRKRIYTAGKNSAFTGLFRVDNLDDIAPDVVTDLTPALEAAGYPAAHPKITDITVSGNGSNVVWVTVGGYDDGQKVFYSTNAGTSWTNISNGLPNLPVNAIVADIEENIYIGTDIGVYYRRAIDSEWQPFYNGLPRVGVSELEIAFDVSQTEYVIVASTYGRGIWISDVAGNCSPTLNITSTQQGQKFYQAGSVINSTSLVNGTVGTNVAFRSAGEINLTPGFNAIPGVEFKAYIGACYSGLPSFRTVIDEKGDATLYKSDIASFKKTGFIEDANLLNNELSVDVILKDTGRFSIRVYDSELKRYIKSVHFTATGNFQKNILIPLSVKERSFLRVDLFKDESIIFMQDAKHK
ncbi:MAG: 3-coathanger stack domain-containing protein [Ferruginibacter sp.]